MESAPCISQTPIGSKKISKNFSLKYNNKVYILTITLLNPEKESNENSEKFLNFNLKENISINEGNEIYYETNQNLNDLGKLFLININKYPDISDIIFSKIENFHSKNNVALIVNDNNNDIINLIYIQKIIDNDDYEIKIELKKKEKHISNTSNDISILNKSFTNLSQEFEKMKLSFEEKLKEKEGENIALKNLLRLNTIIKEQEPINFKSQPDKLTQRFEIKEVVDGGRGMNDHFAVYSLVKDPKKKVYVAIKNKLENSQSSYINIIKINGPNNYKIMQRLYGHNQRIVFVKYYLDPYTDNEYLLSADKEEVVMVWKIISKNNYKRFCYINTFYGQLLFKQSIYSCIIFFTPKKNYVYTTSVTKNYSRLYELEDGAFLRNVTITLNNYTIHLIKYKEYIIDICKDNILIYNPFSEEIYDKIENENTNGENRSGCVIYNKDNTDYLCITNQYGNIIIYDLIAKKILKTIKTGIEFYHIISWNLQYLIVAAYGDNSLWIVDFDENIKKSVFKSINHPICVQKMILNGEEVILCAGGQGYNSLYIYYDPNKLINNKTKK